MYYYGQKGVQALLARRDQFYRYLAQTHPNDRQFLAGWLNRDQALKGWTQHLTDLAAHLDTTLPLAA